MKKERGEEESNIVDILNEAMRRGANDPDNPPTVGDIADRMGIDMFTLADWMQNDRRFKEDLFKVKETLENDPNRDKPDDKIKLEGYGQLGTA
jgi:hypothetical protein